MKKIFLWIACFLFFFSTAWAQNGDYVNFAVLSTEQGLSQSLVKVIVQDYTGLMWIGTENGLNLYDGKKITVFRNSLKDTNSLADGRVHSLFEDSKKRLWIGTHGGGLSLFERQTYRFKNFNRKTNVALDYVYCIQEDKKGRLWLGTDRSVVLFDPETKKIELFDVQKLVAGAYSHIYHILVRENGEIWASGLYIYKFSKEKKIFEIVHGADAPNHTNSLVRDYRKLIDYKGKIWAASTYEGLLQIEGSKIVRADSSCKIDVRNMILDQDKIWLATPKGLHYYDFSKQKIFPISLYENAYYEMSAATTICRDRSGLFWLGGMQGILQVYQNPKKFKNIRQSTPYKQGLSAAGVSAVCGTSDSLVWIGTSEGLVRYDPQSENFKNYEVPVLPNRSTRKSVSSFLENSKKELLVGTPNGLWIFDREKDKIMPFPNKMLFDSIRNTVFSIREDSKGRLLVGVSNGFFVFDPAKNTVKHYSLNPKNPDDPKSLSDKVIRYIFEDTKKRIWLGCTEKGLLRFDDQKEEFIRYQADPHKPKSLSSGTVRCIVEDSEGILWVSTYAGGLNRFDVEKNEFENFTEDDGLCNNTIYGILPDSEGNFWLSTNDGISKFDPKKRVFKNYFREDGIQNNEFNGNAYGKTVKGEILMGGISGLTMFDPKEIQKSLFEPPIILSNFQVLNKDYPLSQHISVTERITLSYKDYVFSFRFAALDFWQGKNNQYAYKMEGFDADWRYVGAENVATYTNLPAGSYTFRVRASNHDQVWAKQELSIRVKINPPFWETWWFRTLVILAVLGGIWYWNETRIRNIKAQKIVLEKLVDARTQELIQKNAELEVQQEELTIQAQNLLAAHSEIEKQHRDIRSSITYAQRIQKAILPFLKEIKNALPDSFVFYVPRDIVSGDFYWFEERRGKKMIAVADCTGHGVPGAFMSLIGESLLNQIVIDRQIDIPSLIVKELSEGIYRVLQQDITENRESIEIAFCVIDPQEGILEFAGAKLPLVYIKNQELHEIKGDKMYAGGHHRHKQQFNNHTLALSQTSFYIFSDGYQDQFGGEKNNKFMGKRFRELLLQIHQNPFDIQEKQVENTLNTWRGGYKQIDDILVIGFRCD